MNPLDKKWLIVSNTIQISKISLCLKLFVVFFFGEKTHFLTALEKRTSSFLGKFSSSIVYAKTRGVKVKRAIRDSLIKQARPKHVTKTMQCITVIISTKTKNDKQKKIELHYIN